MGCDIHMYVEIKKNNKWVEADPWGVDPDYLSADENQKKYHMFVPHNQLICSNSRNYALFGVLAGVRWSEMPLIAEPKGMPNDASPNVTETARQWHGDAHNHSWLTLKELKNFNWNTIIANHYYMDPVQFFLNIQEEIDLTKDSPTHYWSSQKGLGKQISFTEMHLLLDRFFIKELKITQKEYNTQKSLGSLPLSQMCEILHKNRDTLAYSHVHVYTCSGIPLHRYCPEFVNNTIPKLELLSIQPDVEDVRIVFWFDN